jgi:ubiquinone biosynthesis protein
VLRKLGLRRKLPFHKRVEARDHEPGQVTPQLVLKIFEDLDGSFIKLGQLLSLRPDLIPAEYCEELSKLQDKVPAIDGKIARELVEKELGKPIRRLFKSFDLNPLAAASMGQVHLAILKDGTKVAVKVQRPDVQKTVKVDIRLLYRLAGVVRKKYGTKFVNPVEIVREFERYTENELNYLKEAHNIDLFYHNFENSKKITIPKVYWSHTTRKVLTMEHITGKHLSDVTKFKPAQRKRLVDTILNAQFEQIFVHGVFHADPHPGNFLIKRNGKVVLLDLGIVGRMDYLMKEHVTDFFISMVGRDVDGMVESAIKVGTVPEDVDLDQIRRDIHDRLSTYYGATVEQVKMSDALNDIIRLFRSHNLHISPNFVLLAKATVTLEGLAARMYPKLNFVEAAKPFVKRLVKERMHPKRIAERARRKVGLMLEFAESIPRKTTTLLAELHDTGNDLRRIDRDLSMLTTEIGRSSNRVTLGFLAGTLFIASTILLPFQTAWNMPTLSFAGYIVALVVMVFIFISIIREKKI